MHTFDFITIFIFAAIVLITGISFAKAGGKDMKSFFAAGGAVPVVVSLSLIFMLKSMFCGNKKSPVRYRTLFGEDRIVFANYL